MKDFCDVHFHCASWGQIFSVVIMHYIMSKKYIVTNSPPTNKCTLILADTVGYAELNSGSKNLCDAFIYNVMARDRSD